MEQELDEDKQQNENLNELNKIEVEDNEKLKKDSIKEIKNNSDKKNSIISTSIEKQDISDENLETISSNQRYNDSNNNLHNKVKKQKSKKKKSYEFSEYYKKMEDFEKKKAEKILEMKKQLEKKEIKDLRQKPEICKGSIEIINNSNKTKKENVFERMKEKERKANERKMKLKEKINLERAKKKEEEDKPLEFKTNLKPINKKFNKIYHEMKKKNDKKKEEFKIFSEIVKEYERKECTFQPIINKDEKESKVKHRKMNSCDIIQRLYDDEITNRIKRKKYLEKKYLPTFMPKINDASIGIKSKLKFNIKNKKGQNNNMNTISQMRNNKDDTKILIHSAMKIRRKKNFFLDKKRDKSLNDKLNITEIKIINKNEDKNDIIKINKDVINNNDNNKKEENNNLGNNEENINILKKE